jgi:hypothetical protein
MTLADKIIAVLTPGDTLTLTQIRLIADLMTSRLNSYANLEYLEDSIHRLRALLRLPSLPDKHRTPMVQFLNGVVQQRSNYFGTTASGNCIGIPFNNLTLRHAFIPPMSVGSPRCGGSGYQTVENSNLLIKILDAILNDEKTDVEVAVERSRTLLPSPHSSLSFSWFPAMTFARILEEAHKRTKRPDYLNEVITAYRDLRKVSAPRVICFDAGLGLGLFCVFFWARIRCVGRILRKL